MFVAAVVVVVDVDVLLLLLLLLCVSRLTLLSLLSELVALANEEAAASAFVLYA